MPVPIPVPVRRILAVLLLLALLLALLVAPACVTVKPWERGQLARRCMTFGAAKLELRFSRHAGETREGATGGGGGYGGGCGCN